MDNAMMKQRHGLELKEERQSRVDGEAKPKARLPS